eukprot:TRINITY_DN3065_c0_g1_i1.p1 TRINITY_DN3065_c0_g1~~TRINITY_DN3065_c0_g1_i1.p1  ORF type:complete len:564 (-),score=87.49 TRINITY_DN3065_c0_g1_i1:81-1772(-)
MSGEGEVSTNNPLQGRGGVGSPNSPLSPSTSKGRTQSNKKTKKPKPSYKKGKDIIVEEDENGQNEVLKGGTIESIIEWLLEHIEPHPDSHLLEDENYIASQSQTNPGELMELQKRVRERETENQNTLSVFIISYRQFVSPTRFFQILEDRWKSHPSSRYAVVSMLSVWLSKYLNRDFFFHDKGNRLFDQLLEFIGNMAEVSDSDGSNHRVDANRLKLLILRTKLGNNQFNHRILAKTDKDSEMGMGLSTQSTSNNLTSAVPASNVGLTASSANSAGGPSGMMLGVGGGDGDPRGRIAYCEMPLVELAEQLTLIELDMFKVIREREFLNLNWKKPEKKRHSKHIVKMVDRFNKVSFWVGTRIVREKDIKKRTSLLKRFIILADKCRELNNFNTLMEVLAGLNLHPVQRLKQTWANLSDKYISTMQGLEQLMESKKNYTMYREKLHYLAENKESTLPYLGVYLRDLTFIEENTTFLKEQNTLINYEKIQLIGQVIREVQYFQKVSDYKNLRASDQPPTIKYLKKLKGLKEDMLDAKSLECEGSRSVAPPGPTAGAAGPNAAGSGV